MIRAPTGCGIIGLDRTLGQHILGAYMDDGLSDLELVEKANLSGIFKLGATTTLAALRAIRETARLRGISMDAVTAEMIVSEIALKNEESRESQRRMDAYHRSP